MLKVNLAIYIVPHHFLEVMSLYCDVSQLADGRVWDSEAIGSSPIIATKQLNTKVGKWSTKPKNKILIVYISIQVSGSTRSAYPIRKTYEKD